MSGPVKNTDRELYREDTGDPAGSHYENSLFVTASGGIGMNVGGMVIVQPIAEWHRMARECLGDFAAQRRKPPRWWQFWEPRPPKWHRGDPWPGGIR